jgi:hypothetical protein
MRDLQKHSVSLSRLASDIISNTTFKKVVKESDFDYFYNKANRYKDFGSNIKVNKNADFIREMYSILIESYRSEYLYKNIITDKLTSDKKYLRDTIVILNEFKIGKSIADLVFINGSNRVYEIKTELDSPERLKSQINDYRKMFSEVYLVTHYTLQDKYLKLTKDEDIGLIALDSHLELNIIKEPIIQTSYLDIEAIFRTLRKDELINVVEILTGIYPNVPNTLLLEECINRVSLLGKEKIQNVALSEMKKRNLKHINLLKDKKTIRQLKHICLCLDFSAKEYDILHQFLDSNFIN